MTSSRNIARPAGAPAYYQGRPASLWISASERWRRTTVQAGRKGGPPRTSAAQSGPGGRPGTGSL